MDHVDRKVLQVMAAYGGSFIKALAQAGFLADWKNLKKIKDTWREDWEKYEKLLEAIPEDSTLIHLHQTPKEEEPF